MFWNTSAMTSCEIAEYLENLPKTELQFYKNNEPKFRSIVSRILIHGDGGFYFAELLMWKERKLLEPFLPVPSPAFDPYIFLVWFLTLRTFVLSRTFSNWPYRLPGNVMHILPHLAKPSQNVKI